MAFGEKPPKRVDLLEISNFFCKVLVHEPNPEMRLKMDFRSTPRKT